MRQEDESVVRTLPIFEDMRDENVSFLLTASYLQGFPAKMELIQQGNRADFLHVILEGHVEAFSKHGDRETTVSVLGPGDCFILAAVFLDQVYLKSARTLSPSRLLLLPADSVRRAFGRDPAFANRIATELARGYRSLVKEINNLKLRTSLERLANWSSPSTRRRSPACSASRRRSCLGTSRRWQATGSRSLARRWRSRTSRCLRVWRSRCRS